MKINSMFHAFVFFMTVLICSMPLIAVTNQGTLEEEAVAAAKEDATTRVDTDVWFCGGCIGNLVVVFFASVYEPPPPASRLLGKSPEYVDFYSDAYAIEVRERQAESATKGCLVNTCVLGTVGCLYGILAVAR